MVKKNILAVALLSLSSLSAVAGGLLTNTNQNAAYVRQMSQGAIIDLTGLYFNPAGTAFLSDGWHLSLNSQTAFQQRNIETTFPLFLSNQANPGLTHRFEGRAKAPVIPSFQLSYNHDKWSINANFALVGGGGKCEFANGLGSFESAYSGLLNQMMPSMIGNVASQVMQMKGFPTDAANAIGSTASYDGYSTNSYMKGRSYYFGLTLGATYKFMDNLAGYVGLRGIYANCNYNGWVHPSIYFSAPANGAMMFPGADNAEVPLNDYGVNLNCDQSSFGVAPIIGIDYKINDKVNIAAKYEAPTVMKLKNKSEIDAHPLVAENAGALLGKFADGKKIREDVPGMLTVGVQYSPIEKVRLMGTFNEYFDKSAKKAAVVDNKLKDVKGAGVDHNTHEIILGVEYDACKWITISGSWQNTNYGISKEGMSDLSFNLSSNMIGAGIRVNATERCHIDLGYMHTFYQNRTVKDPNPSYMGLKSDKYERKNDVFGIGVTLDF